MCSNSHLAIVNLLNKVGKSNSKSNSQSNGQSNGSPHAFVKVGGPPVRLSASGVFAKDSARALSLVRSQGVRLVGATAWTLCREEWESAFDYLFVDEAGQVSLANFVGISVIIYY